VGDDVDDGVRLLGHEADVDPTVVVTVDDHDARVERLAARAEHAGVGEVLERGPALGFDDGDDVGIHVAGHPGGVGHREFVDALFD